MSSLTRRTFIGGVAAAAACGWVHDSTSLSARLLRGGMGDLRREVTRIARANLSGWSDKTLDVCWAGHATVLVNFFGVHILTDPVLFDFIGAQVGMVTAGRKRLVSSALDPDWLPRIDVVLLSHAHMDHMDLPSLNQMPESAAIITAPGTSDILPKRGAAPRELRWGEKSLLRTAAGEVEIEAIEVKHWGARWKIDTHRGYNGYLLSRAGKKVLFGGDTAYTDAFSSLKGRKIDLAIMPIGSYGSRSGNHCTPEETVAMVNACEANFIVPVHHSTFPLGKEPLQEPLARLEDAVHPDRIAIKQVGEVWRLA